MKYSFVSLAVVAMAATSGCERTVVQPPPTVVTVPGKETVKEVPVPVPGPSGPQGATGAEGQKGEPGKSDGGTVVIVPPTEEKK